MMQKIFRYTVLKFWLNKPATSWYNYFRYIGTFIVVEWINCLFIKTEFFCLPLIWNYPGKLQIFANNLWPSLKYKVKKTNENDFLLKFSREIYRFACYEFFWNKFYLFYYMLVPWQEMTFDSPPPKHTQFSKVPLIFLQLLTPSWLL